MRPCLDRFAQQAHLVAGYFGHNSYITRQFLRAWETIGIPSSPDVNTSNGTLGATKVIGPHIIPPVKTSPLFYRQVSSGRLSLGGVTLTCRLVNFVDAQGRRVTAEKAYLTPEVLKRPNLSVFICAAVTKVILDKSGDQPRAVGVEFTSSRDGPTFKARARKEVILW